MLLIHDHFFSGKSPVHDCEVAKWTKDLMVQLRKSRTHAESLRILEEEKVPTDVVLHFLYHYSQKETTEEERAVREGARLTAAGLAKTGACMCELADRLESAYASIQMAPGVPPALSDLPTPAGLRTSARKLSVLEVQYRKMSSQRPKPRREEFLVWAYLIVHLHTGREHWSDLANLLEIAFLVSGNETEWNQDTLRKIVDRFLRSRPQDDCEIREFLRDHYGDIPTSQSVRRSTRNRRLAYMSPPPLTHRRIDKGR